MNEYTPPTIIDVKAITVIGRRWFDKINGNTYFSADILVNNQLVHSIKYQYGYGDFYMQAAGEWLAKYGYTHPEKYEFGGITPLWRYCEDNNISLYKTVTDVMRKKDL